MSRNRNWCFTLNNYTEDEVADVNKLIAERGIKYVCYGKEVGDEGTPHLQGFIQFVNAKTLVGVKKLIPRAHFEIKSRKSTFEQVICYCEKEDDFYEFGERPRDPVRKGRDEKARWDFAKQCAMQGRVEEIDSDIFIRCYSSLKRIEKDYMQPVSDLDDVCGVWFYGLAGVGKSFKARQDYPNAYFKMANKWWDGYQGEDNVIIDDLDPNHKVLAHHLKIWADRYAFIAEIKSGARKIRPKVICVTSQYSVEEIFQDDRQTIDAIRRRFKIFHITNLGINDNSS